MSTEKLPTLSELVEDNEMSLKENHLMVLLNQPPPEKWLVEHPMIRGYRYIPIERVEYLLSRIYGTWWVEVLNTAIMANSVCVTVRLHVINPLTKKEEWNDGVGAAPIQTDKDAGAMDWNKAKADGVQKALPSAKTYAIKDAADCFGKIFGKDVSRKNQIDYTSLIKKDVDPMTDRINKMIDNAKTSGDLIQLSVEVEIPKELEEKFNMKLKVLEEQEE